jgi:hypothetical protein
MKYEDFWQCRRGKVKLRMEVETMNQPLLISDKLLQ